MCAAITLRHVNGAAARNRSRSTCLRESTSRCAETDQKFSVDSRKNACYFFNCLIHTYVDAASRYVIAPVANSFNDEETIAKVVPRSASIDTVEERSERTCGAGIFRTTQCTMPGSNRTVTSEFERIRIPNLAEGDSDSRASGTRFPHTSASFLSVVINPTRGISSACRASSPGVQSTSSKEGGSAGIIVPKTRFRFP